ncbi:MAG: FUSC family protein [Nocardioidaceae bacterium]|nr:FUSC family protein [Nocardioidaceae bacterium]
MATSAGDREDGAADGWLARPYVDLVVKRSRTSLRARIARLRSRSWQVAQCAIAAGVAWVVAADLFDHATPFFAPIAAVVSLGTSYGQRLRRVAEVTVGVAVGVFLGDLFTHWLGSGGWQIALIVGLAMTSALLLDAGQLFVTQAAIQAIVVSTLLPDPGKAFTRWSDAVIGGAVALVAATVVPQAPLRRPREQAAVVVRRISSLLRSSADSIEDGDVERALATLAEARTTDALIAELRGAADEGLSVIASSPFRYRHRGGVRRMAELVDPLDYALRNTRVIARRVAVACYRREPLPSGYAIFLRDLAEATDAMAAELHADRMASGARDRLYQLADASSRLERTSELSAEVILAQTRSLIADLLAVSGLDPLAATDAIPSLAD